MQYSRSVMRTRKVKLGCLLLIGLLESSSPAATFVAVDDALTAAKRFVWSKQSADGLWETHPAQPDPAVVKARNAQVDGGQWGGDTALAVYALLAAGESPQDPRLIKPIKFLENADIRGMYAVGLRSQLYPFLPPSRQVKSAAYEDIQRYLNSVSTRGPTSGLFDYLIGPNKSLRNDHSVSQYGVLGAWACERAGAEVPTKFWQIVEDGWNRDQLADGSWHYTDESENTQKGTASMTVAGIATLFITQDYVHATNGITCTGNVVNPHIERGLTWLSQNFELCFEGNQVLVPFYCLYGVERVGVASGRKYFGTVDWFKRGSDWLVQHQDMPTGDWLSSLDHTCYAMLFLSRGRAPVVFDKLLYDVDGKEGNWNERPRDVANLTRWIGKQTERDLNWQIVDLKSTTSELLDAPVLYISGNKPLNLAAEDQAKLKDYLESGGLLYANADCANESFITSFEKLGATLFPQYAFRVLPASHPIYVSEQYPAKTWKNNPHVLSLSNGVRELMITAPNADSGRRWQIDESARYKSDFQLADDILLYAVGKNNLQEKGATFTVEPNPRITTSRVIKLARLQYDGNWDPEPGGWRRLASVLHNADKIRLDLSIAKLGSNELGTGHGVGVHVASLTGAGLIKLSVAQRKELSDFVEGGGTLIVDAAGGNTEFASSVEGELSSIFGSGVEEELKTPMDESTDVFKAVGGAPMAFRLRSFTRANLGTLRGPQLSAILIHNRPAVYYSRLDLSAGLVGSYTDGINGYEPSTATALMANLVIRGGLGASALPSLSVH